MVFAVGGGVHRTTELMINKYKMVHVKNYVNGQFLGIKPQWIQVVDSTQYIE